MGENGKMENLQDALAQSIDDCNKHYHGMVKVYKALLILLREEVDMSVLEEKLKEVLPGVERNDPASHGISDGMKRAKRLIEYLRDGSQTIDEVKTYLNSEMDRMNRLLSVG